jgi:Branched-chain amino acid transport protein (AzlD)
VALPLVLALVLGLAALTFALRGVGPFLTTVPPAIAARTAGLAPALLAALVATELTNTRGVFHPDARLAAVILSAGLASLRLPVLVCVVAGALAAGLLRATGH